MIYLIRFNVKVIWFDNCILRPFLKLFFCFRQLGLSAELSNSLDMTPAEHRNICAKLDYFVDRQKELCSRYDRILPVRLLKIIFWLYICNDFVTSEQTNRKYLLLFRVSQFFSIYMNFRFSIGHFSVILVLPKVLAEYLLWKPT